MPAVTACGAHTAPSPIQRRAGPIDAARQLGGLVQFDDAYLGDERNDRRLASCRTYQFSSAKTSHPR